MQESMRKQSKPVSFRLDESQFAQFASQASLLGVSPGGLARDLVIEHLSAKQKESVSITQIAKLVQAVRSDLATATGAILAFSAQGQHPPDEISAWVRNNLNR